MPKTIIKNHSILDNLTLGNNKLFIKKPRVPVNKNRKLKTSKGGALFTNILAEVKALDHNKTKKIPKKKDFIFIIMGRNQNHQTRWSWFKNYYLGINNIL